MNRFTAAIIFITALPATPASTIEPSTQNLIDTAIKQLLDMQEEDGAWPYEGVYRVNREIPVGYHIGGTAIVCETLLHAAPGNKDAAAAIERGIAVILKDLEHPLMKPSTKDAYDVRVWGHSFALEIFCELRGAGRMGKFKDEIERWIPKLVRTVLTEELTGGGWNYASRREPATFVTAPVTQALLMARSQGEKVPDEVLGRAKSVLMAAKTKEDGFVYSGKARPRRGASQLPGAIARTAACETTLILLGAGSRDAIKLSLDAFHEHWGELEKRRKKTGTHLPPYMIAPYYFYYGHRYAAQAIEMLPKEQRESERKRLLEVILRTRDEDGTWNDRVFPRSRNFGTAMCVVALLADGCPLPPKYTPSPASASAPASRPAR